MIDRKCDPKNLVPKDFIKELEEIYKAKEDSIVEFEGYVGSSSREDKIRLYKTLDLSSYVEIPADSVIYCIDFPGDSYGRVKIFVPGSAKVNSVTESCEPARNLLFSSFGSIPPYICQILYSQYEQTQDQNLVPALRACGYDL